MKTISITINDNQYISVREWGTSKTQQLVAFLWHRALEHIANPSVDECCTVSEIFFEFLDRKEPFTSLATIRTLLNRLKHSFPIVEVREERIGAAHAWKYDLSFIDI
ncbi:MAG: hypothetical protein MJZ15_04415 [Bacteroidales bacterium]|nr:hypothetical protein [Bacteroidales bacterium]